MDDSHQQSPSICIFARTREYRGPLLNGLSQERRLSCASGDAVPNCEKGAVGIEQMNYDWPFSPPISVESTRFLRHATLLGLSSRHLAPTHLPMRRPHSGACMSLALRKHYHLRAALAMQVDDMAVSSLLTDISAGFLSSLQSITEVSLGRIFDHLTSSVPRKPLLPPSKA
ncbi:hypothetical protein OBBRIDRAFT_358039 [Obba rivulosa]|uniref:Uncharacterized protein n=1 Tax=Obba rivulosa TaxID=1052685 RepID=A0A8E2AMX2_9APHY|nr:hypothetical protein OBBRIDRAFT_358039 [Obba rivulosa]